MYGLLGSCCIPALMIESACLVASGTNVSSSIHLAVYEQESVREVRMKRVTKCVEEMRDEN